MIVFNLLGRVVNDEVGGPAALVSMDDNLLYRRQGKEVSIGLAVAGGTVAKDAPIECKVGYLGAPSGTDIEAFRQYFKLMGGALPVTVSGGGGTAAGDFIAAHVDGKGVGADLKFEPLGIGEGVAVNAHRPSHACRPIMVRGGGPRLGSSRLPLGSAWPRVGFMQRAGTIDWDATAERLDTVRATAGDFAEAARAHFGDRLRAIRLFGSAARGDWQEGSDADVLILLDEARSEDRRWIAECATRLGILDSGVVLSTVTLAERDFDQMGRRERLFAREIERDGVPL